jgi:hypothetical protein
MEKRIWEVADGVHAADDAAVGHLPLALFTGVLGCLESYRPKLVTTGIGKAAYRGGA